MIITECAGCNKLAMSNTDDLCCFCRERGVAECYACGKWSTGVEPVDNVPTCYECRAKSACELCGSTDDVRGVQWIEEAAVGGGSIEERRCVTCRKEAA